MHRTSFGFPVLFVASINPSALSVLGSHHRVRSVEHAAPACLCFGACQRGRMWSPPFGVRSETPTRASPWEPLRLARCSWPRRDHAWASLRTVETKAWPALRCICRLE